MFVRNNNRGTRGFVPQGKPGARVLIALALIVVLGGVCLAGTAYAGTVSLPQTGQTTSYAAGDDGVLRVGVAWPSPRFTDNGDQTVTDNLTGLVWTKNAGTPTVGSCTGGYMNWQGALNYVACLNTANYLGYTDWRLPNINELESLANLGQANMTTWLISQGFTNVFAQSSLYWSSTSYANDTSYAWFFIDGCRVDIVGKSSLSAYGRAHYVWPVRSGQSGAFGNSVISKSGTGDGTITSLPDGRQ
ncbi:MAG: DUF1566 domain-containing protein [Magnetococcales bacterium]|nr:DUF1566 domain-containing protein [Nitrospirota bacterium]